MKDPRPLTPEVFFPGDPSNFLVSRLPPSILAKELKILPFKERTAPPPLEVKIDRFCGQWYRRHEDGHMEVLHESSGHDPNAFVLQGELGVYMQTESGWVEIDE